MIRTRHALVAVPDVQAAVALLARMRSASGDRVSSFELIRVPPSNLPCDTYPASAIRWVPLTLVRAV